MRISQTIKSALLGASAALLLAASGGPAWSQLAVRGFLFNTASGIYTPIDDPLAARGTEALAVNDSGQVVGFYVDSGMSSHGFIYNNGIYTTIDHPASVGYESVATGVNNAGQVVGWYFGSDKRHHGYLYSGGVFTTIDNPNVPPDGEGTLIEGINNNGMIVGVYVAKPCVWCGSTHGFTYKSGVFTALDVAGAAATMLTAINDSGAILGKADFAPRFSYQAGAFTSLANDPVALNNSGQMVGYTCTGLNCTPDNAYIINAGALTSLSDPLATGGTYPLGLNNSGQVVGWYRP